MEENTENLPVFIMRKKMFAGKAHWYAEPLERVKPGNLGWFNSGNILDMEMETQKEVFIHDRQETQKDYDGLGV